MLELVLSSLRHIRKVLNENQVALSKDANMSKERKQWKKAAKIVGDIRTIHDNIQYMHQISKKGM